MSALDVLLTLVNAGAFAVVVYLARLNGRLYEALNTKAPPTLMPLLSKTKKPEQRIEQRNAYAKASVAYAEQIGGENDKKLLHAISAFQKMDLADNGKRDYSDAEARIAVESVLKAK